MTKIPNLNDYNSPLNARREMLKVKNLNDEILLFSKEEAREALNSYIHDELAFYSDELTKQRKIDLESRINFKLKQIENAMVNHIDDKVNKITERIIELTTTRIFEEEVEKRLELRLKKIKDSL